MTRARRRPGGPADRGLGWAHQQQRRRLLARHRDGTPCPCLDDDTCGPACPCRPAGVGLPMHRKAERNADGMPLEADHTLARSQGGTLADRLMLATCNRSRGDGTRRRPANDAPSWWSRQWYPTSSSARLVVLLCGPPGAGKTTTAAQSGLTVYDRDDPQWASEREFTAALTALAHDPAARAVVLRSAASSSARAKAAALCRPTHTYLLLPPTVRHAEQRIAHRDGQARATTLAALHDWYARHDRHDGVPLSLIHI